MAQFLCQSRKAKVSSAVCPAPQVWRAPQPQMLIGPEAGNPRCLPKAPCLTCPHGCLLQAQESPNVSTATSSAPPL